MTENYRIYQTNGLAGEEIKGTAYTASTAANVWSRVQDAIKDTGFNCYYVRVVGPFENKKIWTVDYGSHSKFITIECMDDRAFEEYKAYWTTPPKKVELPKNK